LLDAGWAEDNPGAASLPATTDENVLRLNKRTLPGVINVRDSSSGTYDV
jgi:hypothetical protein